MCNNFNWFVTFLIKIIFYISISNSYCQSDFRSDDDKMIRNVLENQVKAWNNGSMEQYMNGYWNSDSLRFIGKNGIKYGWQNTLNNYKKNYPDKVAMGKLKFDIFSVEFLSVSVGFVIGKWKLEQQNVEIGGIFTLIFQIKNGKWVITCDHTS
jgi:hypothetical protein